MSRNQRQPRRAPASSDSFGTLSARASGAEALRLAATSRFTITPPRPPHADDVAVDQMAEAMKAKLAAKRVQGYRGWDNPLECSGEKLAQMLAESVGKGDPVDVANFAMMLYARGVSHNVIAEQALRALLRCSREDQTRRIADLAEQLSRLRALIDNDGYAMSFQTMDQYRTALLKYAGNSEA